MRQILVLAAALAAAVPAAHVRAGEGNAPMSFDELTPAPYVILCGAAAAVAQSLRQAGEVVAAHGRVAQKEDAGLRAQFWVNPATKDWTVVYVDAASAMACMIAAGTAFAIDRPQPAPDRRNAL